MATADTIAQKLTNALMPEEIDVQDDGGHERVEAACGERGDQIDVNRCKKKLI